MNPRRVLYCGLMPEFDRDSGSRRVLHQLEFLQESGWTVTFVSHHAECTHRYAQVLQQRGIAVFKGATEWVPRLVDTGDYQLVIFGLWHVAEPHLSMVRRVSPETCIIVDSVDLHFLRLSRQAFQQKIDHAVPQLGKPYGEDAVRELNVYAASDAVLTVSRKEAELIEDFVGERGLAFSTPDCEVIELSTTPCENRRGALFVGCYRHAPNLDAILYLRERIVPLMDPDLLRRHPIQIVGDGLDSKTHAMLDRTPGFEVIGWVPEVDPWFSMARAFIVPLRYGAGTKRKVLQATLAGTPIVTTRVGAEGFDLRDGDHAFVTDDPDEFADRLRRLLTEDDLWQRLRDGARRQILASHGREPAYAQFQSALRAALSRIPKAAPDTEVESAAISPDAAYRKASRRLRSAAAKLIPAGSTALVVSKGDDALLRIPDLTAMHFPQNADGTFTGYHPADDTEALHQLSRLHASGAGYFILPDTSRWWLEHYQGLAEYLTSNWDRVFDDMDTGVIYAARSSTGKKTEIVFPAAANSNGSDSADVRLIAFYLPQFHPIPENDRWWGKGFTEWTNVSKAKPLFPGHVQPRVPTDLGYYDLRLPEARQAQADLARQYGIHGFCYYHYWFGGKRLLERPFDEVLRSGNPDLPFCLCWANEPWSRRWDSSDKDILQAQTYSHEDDLAHIRWLAEALCDPRAIRIGGKPALLIYQAKDLPEPGRTADTWRSEARRLGVGDLYLMTVETGWDAGWDATACGYDAKVLFQPQFSTLNTAPRVPIAGEGPRVFDYDTAWPILANAPSATYRRYDTVFPGWDNTARKGAAGWVVHGSTPESYEAWLRTAIQKAKASPAGEQVVFINAWNEWGEGAYLEPDRANGRRYLEATKRAQESVSMGSTSFAAAANGS